MTTVALIGGRVLDGLGSDLPHATVLLDGDRIEAVTSARAPQGVPTVDVGGRTVIPGLIDAHVHLSSYDPLPIRLRGEEPLPPELRYFHLANVARAMLDMGITTARDVGSMDDHALVLRRAVWLGLTPGPRILTCARILSATAPGGVIFGTMYREADGAEEMRKAVREQVRRGADFIKVMATGARSVLLEDPEPAQVTEDEIAAVVDQARHMGMRVAAHAEGIGGARLAVMAGVDTIEHGLSLHRDPALLERMASQGSVLVPTLSTFHDLSEDVSELYPEALVEQAKRQRDEAYRTIVAARDAGVTIAMGFDSYPAGTNARELVRMVDAGLTPMEGLRAATRGGAIACGREDLGAIREDAAADLLVIDGDPLADVATLTRPEAIWAVYKGGRRVAGAGPEPPRG